MTRLTNETVVSSEWKQIEDKCPRCGAKMSVRVNRVKDLGGRVLSETTETQKTCLSCSVTL